MAFGAGLFTRFSGVSAAGADTETALFFGSFEVFCLSGVPIALIFKTLPSGRASRTASMHPVRRKRMFTNIFTFRECVNLFENQADQSKGALNAHVQYWAPYIFEAE